MDRSLRCGQVAPPSARSSFRGRLGVARRSQALPCGGHVAERSAAPRVPRGCVACRHSAHLGNQELVGTLLQDEAKTQVNCADADGRMPLHWAASSDDKLEIVRMLLDAGAAADVDARDCGGWTPLMIAASAGASRVVSELLERCVVSTDLADTAAPTCTSAMRARLRRCTMQAAETVQILCARCSRPEPT